MSGSREHLAESIAAHIAALCAAGSDRFPGTAANDRAVAEVADRMRGLGLEVESLPFETVGWRRGSARIEFDDRRAPLLHPGPFSPPLPPTRVRIVSASTASDLADLPDVRGAALVLHGEVAAEQLLPRGYPFYENPEHARVLDEIERLAPLAVVAATGKHPASTAALSPFPLIEDGAFPIPSAYLAAEDVAPLLEAELSGASVTLAIDSDRFATTGEQIVGRLGRDDRAVRVIVCAHIDTKPDTPGALDNASGVAVISAVAGLLASRPPGDVAVEVVPFNGEDHFAAPGELAYLAAHPPGDDIALVVNIDGAGLAGGPSEVSAFGLDAATEQTLGELIESSPGVQPGDPWFASDHAIFAAQGVPAIAITSAGFEQLMSEFAHTPADTPELVDADVLADTARFVAEVVLAIDRAVGEAASD